MRSVQDIPKITIDGIQVKEPLQLASLRVVQRLDAPAQCQLSWEAGTLDIRALEDVDIAMGTRLTVRIETQPSAIFTGEITAVEHVHQPSGGLILRVRAYDALIRLQRRQTLRTQVDVSTAELARVLADSIGLSLRSDDHGPVWPRVIPRFNHDLALLRHYARRSGLHFVAENDQLHLFPLRSDRGRALDLTLGEDLYEARLEHNVIRPMASIQILGWDVHTGEPRQSKAGSAAGMPAPAQDFSKQRSLLGSPLESEREAEVAADAALARNQSAQFLLWGVAEGNTALRPGRRVHLHGVAVGMAGPHRLTVVTHTVDAEGGYLCELSTEPEPMDEPEALPGLVLGEVCDIDDPEQRGRVQVSLASYADAITTWMLVVQLGAGADKGLVSLPEVGDQVVVALPDGDPSQGLVLGGVYDADGPPHESGRANAPGQHYPYTLATRGGQRIQLNDAEGAIRLENAAGSFLSLRPEGIVLHAAGSLVLESPGERLRLSGDRIDLQRS